ncbi:MAG: hypothetical protein GY756_27605, partial [bacterium]|nr:hypothetical protein [bacterium]
MCMIQGFNPVFGQEDLELPEVMLPSPTAFQMTKYGDVPINESSGKISPSIPIHTYKAGKLQLPISLGYVGNGVKVDDIAGWTGINWSLNAGGVITRIVRDYKDEYSHLNGYRVLYDQSDLQNMELVSLSDDAIQLNIIESRKTYDTEADLFNFSFAGYSGSFYLNEEFEEVLTNYDNELKIKCYLLGYDDEKQRIEITTPDGIIYYFGGDNATEQTKDSPGSDRAFSATTSYYLTKIVHPTGDEINLTYIDEGDPYFVRQSLSHHIKKKAPSFGSVNCPELIPSDELNPQQSHLNISRIYNGKHLREISSNRSSLKVKFDSESYNNDYEYRRMLNKIVFTDTNLNKDIKTASLSYYSDSERFFLTQVSFSDAKFKYGMEYNEPESLPERFSYSQDHLGYFNGQSNLTLIPKNESSHFEFMNAYLADREPYFEYATKGSLIKMTYPTGGYTLFEYEAPPVKVHDIRRVHLKSYCGQTNLIPDAKLIDCSSIGGLAIDEEGNKISTFDEDQQIDINLSVKAEGNINHLYKVYVKVIDLERDTETVKVLPLAYMVYTYNEVFTFDLKKDHRYKIEIELDPGTSYGSEIYPVYVNAYLDYIKGYKNVDGLGFRVKGVKNYTDESSEPTIKRYYYRGISEINNEYEESFVNINWSLYEYSSTYAALCSTSSIPGMASFPHMEYHTFSNMKSNTLRTLFSTSDNTLLYDDVTISYGGDNFENGGIQKSFRNTTAYHPQYHFGGGTRMFSGVQRENADMYNKLLRKEVFFNKGEDNQLYKIKENIYNYREFWNFEKSITNMIIKRTYSICEGEENVNNSMKGLS